MIVTEKNLDDPSRMKSAYSLNPSAEFQGLISVGKRLRTIILSISMRSRFQITVSNRQVPGTPVQRSGFWSRIKRFWAGVALATLAVGVLIAALILGSVIAVLLAILLIIGVAIVVVRAALLRSKQA
jgi:Flp pilus assembly protein TadB